MNRTRVAAGCLSAAIALAGCLEIGTGGTAEGASPGLSKRTAPKTIQVADRLVRIAGPKGYCIDKSATTESGGAAFVLLGSCAAISQNPRDDTPGALAVLTASVVSRGDADLARLESFFNREQGRAALSRTGRADTVRVLQLTRTDEVVILHASDTSENRLGDFAPDYWRGLFFVNDHLVTVTAAALANRPMAAADGRELIKDFVARIRAVNPDGNKSGIGLQDLFNRLL